MMKHKIYYIFFMIISGYASGVVPLSGNALLDKYKKLHEEWWQYTLDNTVSFNLFATWLGDERSPSRQAVYRHVKQQKYESLLDIPCGLCIDFFGLQYAGVSVDYYGIDITQKLVALARQKQLNVWLGTIENIPSESSCFDICYARHILEHLDYYEKALSELIRVARKEALVVFFIKPHDAPDFIDFAELDGHIVCHNRYNRTKLETYVRNHAKVLNIAWESVSENEEILQFMPPYYHFIDR